VPGVARGVKKIVKMLKKFFLKNPIFSQCFPRDTLSSLNKCQFGSAVCPAITNM